MSKRLTTPSIIFAIIFGIAGAFAGPFAWEIWPNKYSDGAGDFARAIAAAYKLDRNGSISQEALAHEYLGRFSTPKEISIAIADDLNKNPPIKDPATKAGKYSDVQLLEEYMQYSIPELEKILVEFGKSQKPPKSLFVLSFVVIGIGLGALVPHLCSACWGFLLKRIRELSLAIQGKGSDSPR